MKGGEAKKAIVALLVIMLAFFMTLSKKNVRTRNIHINDKDQIGIN